MSSEDVRNAANSVGTWEEKADSPPWNELNHRCRLEAYVLSVKHVQMSAKLAGPVLARVPTRLLMYQRDLGCNGTCVLNSPDTSE